MVFSEAKHFFLYVWKSGINQSAKWLNRTLQKNLITRTNIAVEIPIFFPKRYNAQTSHLNHKSLSEKLQLFHYLKAEKDLIL